MFVLNKTWLNNGCCISSNWVSAFPTYSCGFSILYQSHVTHASQQSGETRSSCPPPPTTFPSSRVGWRLTFLPNPPDIPGKYLSLHFPLSMITFMCYLFCELHLFLQSFFQQLFIELLVPGTVICAGDISVNKQTCKILVFLKLPSNSMKTMTKFIDLCPLIPQFPTHIRGTTDVFFRKS